MMLLFFSILCKNYYWEETCGAPKWNLFENCIRAWTLELACVECFISYTVCIRSFGYIYFCDDHDMISFPMKPWVFPSTHSHGQESLIKSWVITGSIVSMRLTQSPLNSFFFFFFGQRNSLDWIFLCSPSKNNCYLFNYLFTLFLCLVIQSFIY